MRQSSLLAALALACALPADAQETFHGDVTRSGVFASAAPPTSPRIKWSFKASGPIVGSPVARDGVVYIACLGGHLYAVDQTTGVEKWSFKSRMPIASTPALGDSTLYFVSSAGSLAALDLANGTPRWVLPVEYERRFEAKNLHGYPSAAQTIPDSYDLFTSSPALSNGKVYFGAGDGGIYCADATSGLLLWKFSTENVVHASPSIANGMVYAGSWDSRLYALDADSGQLRWSYQAGVDPAIHNQEGFQSSAAVVNGVVYVGCRDAHLYAIDAGSGKKRWDYPTSKGWVIGTPAVREGQVYAGTSDGTRVFSLDAKTGRLRWNFDAKGYTFSSPAIAGNLVLIGCHNGRLYALDAATGALNWTFQTDAAKSDRLDVLNDDGSFKQESFAPLFGDYQDMVLDVYRYISVGGIVSSPMVDHGVVYVGSLDGNLYALE